MTGSGMGCPDWPKCFGLWVPPLNESELPINYKEIYAHRGYDKLDFNVFHTWIEYINRLLGLVSGFFCVGLLFLSLFLKNKLLIFLNLFLVSIMGLQGWMGAVVVYSVLAPFKITLHMLLALFILSLLLFLNRITSKPLKVTSRLTRSWISGTILITIIQIILGTQVRENVDVLLESVNRYQIVSQLSHSFEAHRLIAWLVLLTNIGIVFYYRKSENLYCEIRILFFVLVLLILMGIFMSYYGLFGWAQLLHLIFAVLLFMTQTSILLKHLNLATLRFP